MGNEYDVATCDHCGELTVVGPDDILFRVHGWRELETLRKMMDEKKTIEEMQKEFGR